MRERQRTANPDRCGAGSYPQGCTSGCTSALGSQGRAELRRCLHLRYRHVILNHRNTCLNDFRSALTRDRPLTG
jgi:hypothetical protein